MATTQPFKLIYAAQVKDHINIGQREVYIVAVGVKQGNTLFIGGEEVEL